MYGKDINLPVIKIRCHNDVIAYAAKVKCSRRRRIIFENLIISVGND